MDDTHDCPGGCGRRVERAYFSCPQCWARLPLDLQRPIMDNYRRDEEAHFDAMVDALEWYSSHPH